MKRIKILILSTSRFIKREGISTVIFDYFCRFDRNLFELHIAVDGDYNSDLVNEFMAAGILADYLPSRKKELKNYSIELLKLLKRERFDAIYANGSSALMCIELVTAFLVGCKVRIVHSHNTTNDHKLIDKILRPFFYLLCTDAFACGEEAGRFLFGKHEFTIIKNGRDILKYKYNEKIREQTRQLLHIDNDCLLIGHVGNFNYKKNQKFILEIFSEILKINPNTKLFLMGTGDQLEEMKILAKELEISNHVVFTGSISNVDQMLQAMDIMVLPSIHEGLPLAVVEWQIAALPCLLSENVTTEVAFCDLVHFMSLNNKPKEWAREILKLPIINRKEKAEITQELAKKSGFDINENAVFMQQYLVERISNN